jgi:hypothetical protein
LAVEDGSTEGSALAWQTEEKELSLTGYDGPRAKAEYDTAEALFAQVGERRDKRNSSVSAESQTQAMLHDRRTEINCISIKIEIIVLRSEYPCNRSENVL